MPLQPLGPSLWEVSMTQVRLWSMLTLMGEFPSLSAMAYL